MKIALGVFLSSAPRRSAQNDIRGFSADEAQAQREREAKAHAIPDTERLRAYMERMAAEPHIAGSPPQRPSPTTLPGLLRSWGLEVAIEEFEALLALSEGSLAGDDGAHEFTRQARRSRAFPRPRLRRQGPGSDV